MKTCQRVERQVQHLTLVSLQIPYIRVATPEKLSPRIAGNCILQKTKTDKTEWGVSGGLTGVYPPKIESGGVAPEGDVAETIHLCSFCLMLQRRCVPLTLDQLPNAHQTSSQTHSNSVQLQETIFPRSESC
jgi:hypothetical protein